ncbi:MAG: Na+/H+ antiporter subunit E [Alphaproteobacteria bacterium]
MNTKFSQNQNPVRQKIEVFAFLLLFWILLNGSLAPGVLGVGAVVALVIMLFSRDGMTFLTGFRYTPKALLAALLYLLFFFKELMKANLRLAKIVLSPSMPINPGFVKVRTSLKSPMGRFLLANSITLTPGTLTIEMEGEWLYVHWVTMDASDIDEATDKIVTGFERYLEVMYG